MIVRFRLTDLHVCRSMSSVIFYVLTGFCRAWCVYPCFLWLPIAGVRQTLLLINGGRPVRPCLDPPVLRGHQIGHSIVVLFGTSHTNVMKVVATKSRSTVQLIEIELSKAYLHRALRFKDSDSDSIYCVANVYLAVLYYTTGQYQTAIDHCILAMRSQDHSQCSSHVVQGELLPKIDDDIDTVLGLAVFYQHIRRSALKHQQTQHVAVFSTEMFAQTLSTWQMSVNHRNVIKCWTSFTCKVHCILCIPGWQQSYARYES